MWKRLSCCSRPMKIWPRSKSAGRRLLFSVGGVIGLEPHYVVVSDYTPMMVAYLFNRLGIIIHLFCCVWNGYELVITHIFWASSMKQQTRLFTSSAIWKAELH